MGVGVFVNVIAVVIGSLTGKLLKNVINKQTIAVIIQAQAIVSLGVGVLDLVNGLNTLSSNGFAYGGLMLIIILIVGGFIGSITNLQYNFEKFGRKLQSKLTKNDDSTLGVAFIQTTTITCVGAMTIYGSIKCGLGDHSTLYIKSVLDFVLCMIFTMKYGMGSALCAIPLFIYEGAIMILGYFLSSYILGTNFYYMLSAVGGLLVICIGINLLEIKQIRTVDLLPAVLVCLVMYLF